MSPSFSYQRHTPGRVPFEETFSWQDRPNLSAIRTLSEQCYQVDQCRNLDDGLIQAVQGGLARAWLDQEGRAYVQMGPNQLELLVHPQCRGQGWGQWLLQASLQQAQGCLEVWAYGDRPRVVVWLERAHFKTHRVLYSLRRQGPPPPAPEWPGGWQVRSFRKEDLPAWHALHTGLQSDPARAWSEHRLLSQLQQPDTPAQNFWLLHHDGQLRGYAWLKRDEIFMFALDPQCRGCGMGRRLLQFALSRCKEAAWGYCDDTRPEALGLYHKLGFAEVGRDRCLRRSM
ncbi:GNAT family N-acetyltransferase [bacterium]|nr:GNAT family N-acetyltransferase [bacterium]